jgi:hypothetical protein
MAVDTAQKRFAIMNHGCPWRGVMIVPTGTVDAEERAAFFYHYGGIAFGDIATTVNLRTVGVRRIVYVPLDGVLRVRLQRTSGSDDLQTVVDGSALCIRLRIS